MLGGKQTIPRTRRVPYSRADLGRRLRNLIPGSSHSSRKTVETKSSTGIIKRHYQDEEDGLAAQDKEIMFLQKKLENNSKLEALKAKLAQNVPITLEPNVYNRGEMVLATVHGQDARIIMNGSGTFSWITREFLYKIKDARAAWKHLKSEGWRGVMVLV